MDREIVYRDAQRQACQLSPQSQELHEATELHPKEQNPEGMGNGGTRGAKRVRGRPVREDKDANAAGSSIMCSLLFFSKCSRVL